jgi:hypothetical protein
VGAQAGISLLLAIPLLLTMSLPAAEKTSRKEELQYYREEFEAGYKYPIYDTLFEKIVWERKVSHLVMEFHNNEYRVTLLMMEEYPYNYKGQNYPIHFAFKTFPEAAKKFEAMNLFLRNNGVMAVGIEGKKIVKERILVNPVGSSPPRPVLGTWPGKKDTDPILTREPLPRRLPLEKRYDSATSR